MNQLQLDRFFLYYDVIEVMGTSSLSLVCLVSENNQEHVLELLI